MDFDQEINFDVLEDFGSESLESHDLPMRTNDMKYTDQETVVEVYALGRALAKVGWLCLNLQGSLAF